MLDNIPAVPKDHVLQTVSLCYELPLSAHRYLLVNQRDGLQQHQPTGGPRLQPTERLVVLCCFSQTSFLLLSKQFIQR